MKKLIPSILAVLVFSGMVVGQWGAPTKNWVQEQIADSIADIWDSTRVVPSNDSTVWVSSNGTYTTIAAGVAAAKSGGKVNIGIGTYNERKVAINKPLTISGETSISVPNVLWWATDSLFVITDSTHGIVFENIAFQSTLSSRLAIVGANEVTWRNCAFTCSTFAMNPAGSSFHKRIYDCSLYPLQHGGFTFDGSGVVRFKGNNSINQPTGYVWSGWSGKHYGIKVTNGIVSFLDGGNFYADSTVFWVTGSPSVAGGNVSIYNGPICKVLGSYNASVVDVDSGGMCNFFSPGGSLTNSTPTTTGLPTVSVAVGGKFNMYNGIIANKGGGKSYVSIDTLSGGIFNNVEFHGARINGIMDITNFFAFDTDTGATDPKTKITAAADTFFVSQALQVGRGTTFNFFAAGIDTFNAQAQTDTVTVAYIPAGASIYWQMYGTSLDSTSNSANVAMGGKIISTGASGKIVVKRLQATGTFSLIYCWKVEK